VKNSQIPDHHVHNRIPKAGPRLEKQRITISLPKSLIEQLRNAVYWTENRTLTRVITDALENAAAQLEHANGGPYPERIAPLKVGRRPRQQPPSSLNTTEFSSGVCLTG
jgi:hypothetical protein